MNGVHWPVRYSRLEVGTADHIWSLEEITALAVSERLMTPNGSYLFDLPREMEPAIEAIATTTGRSMEEIVRVLLNHAVASNPLCRALTAPRMPDLHLAPYTIAIELKRSAVEECVDDVLAKLAGYAI